MAAQNASRRPSAAELHEAICSGLTLREVAELYGVALCTIYEWRKRPEYKRHLATLTGMAFDRVSGEAAKLIASSIEAAARIVADPGADKHAQLAAARLLLEQASRLHERDELAAAAEGTAPAEDAVTLGAKVRGLLSRAVGGSAKPDASAD